MENFSENEIMAIFLNAILNKNLNKIFEIINNKNYLKIITKQEYSEAIANLIKKYYEEDKDFFKDLIIINTTVDLKNKMTFKSNIFFIKKLIESFEEDNLNSELDNLVNFLTTDERIVPIIKDSIADNSETAADNNILIHMCLKNNDKNYELFIIKMLKNETIKKILIEKNIIQQIFEISHANPKSNESNLNIIKLMIEDKQFLEKIKDENTFHKLLGSLHKYDWIDTFNYFFEEDFLKKTSYDFINESFLYYRINKRNDLLEKLLNSSEAVKKLSAQDIVDYFNYLCTNNIQTIISNLTPTPLFIPTSSLLLADKLIYYLIH